MPRRTAALLLALAGAAALPHLASAANAAMRPGDALAQARPEITEQPAPRVERGSLRRGDPARPTGENYDPHEFRAQAGQRIRITMESDDFDTYLILIDPEGNRTVNDDADQDGGTNSAIDIIAAHTGRYTIHASSYAVGERGRYTLTIDVRDDSRPARPVQAVQPHQGHVIERAGTLRQGDEQLRTGEYFDRYPFEGRAGQRVTVRLESTDFNPYLILKAPSEAQQENDDHRGSRTVSQIEHTLTESGTYEVLATSFASRETGRYTLTVTLEGEGTRTPPEAAPQTPPAPETSPARTPPREPAPLSGPVGVRVETGSLRRGDETLETGEYADTYRFTAEAGQHVVVRLNSSDFDTYLIVQPPEGDQLENDDYNGSTSVSFIEATAPTSGEWVVRVTSFEPGETGDYTLTMSVSNSAVFYTRQDALPIADDGRRVSGSLARSDLQRFTGEYADVYSFDGVPGRFYTAEVRTNDRSLDTYLLLERERGANLVNDDIDGSTQVSRLQFLVTQPGPVDLIVSSYAVGMTGRYTVTLTSQDQAPPHHHEPSVVPGRIYGVFAGITDYTARGQTNLQYCAQDAQRAHDAAVNGLGMSPGDAVLLLDDHATVRAFEDAITSLGPRLSHDDVLIVFYSGHGGQVERTTFQPADPDMLDEILVLADDDLTDDRLDELLRVVNAGTVLIVLDACNSGGFAKDVISAPGRMGLFASAEDCLSIVATEREAGGYLSDFFIEAIGHGRHQADTNGDGLLTVIELCQFIAERYRTEVTSDSKPPVTPRLYERTISPTQYRGYQLLHIDRGSIGPHEVLFGW